MSNLGRRGRRALLFGIVVSALGAGYGEAANLITNCVPMIPTASSGPITGSQPARREVSELHVPDLVSQS